MENNLIPSQNVEKRSVMCVYCGTYFKDITDWSIFQNHIKQCQDKKSRETEIEDLVKLSKNKVCAICLEKVLSHEKVSDRNFGLLENCSHIFCLHCIREWRKSKDSSFQNVRACPICRVISYYIIPSFFFPQTVNEKTVIIENYKAALKQKHCVHFNHGVSVCPFSTSCFFRHEFPDGSLADKSQLVMNSEGILQIYSPYLYLQLPLITLVLMTAHSLINYLIYPQIFLSLNENFYLKL
uniref:RING-type E3 ubiquitin transferase n=1 Tax=Henneguya salminicola TaxID=69463 RepID=A0A6G3MI81_HENSL